MKEKAGSEIINLELTDSDVLKPCPFCGSNDLEFCNTWTAHYWVECNGCDAQCGDHEQVSRDPDKLEDHQASKAAAIAAWNSRT